ncbi:hypothetical protein KC315_g7487 [Hortaea werneckii]|nr:hypothetical protein KC315_g7487 [Hortaea werneckii]
MQRRRGGGGMGGGGMQSHHREYGTLYSVPPGGGSGTGDSAASLLDAEDKLHLDSYEAGEASRKRIAAAQRERDLQRRLGAMGKGVGAEYMQASLEGGGTAVAERGKGSDPLSAHQEQQQQQQHFEKPSAADLGLLGKQADTAHLSPAKDRRRHFGLGAAGMNSATTTSSAGRQGTGLGWGGARKAGLLLEQQQRGQSNDNETNDVGRHPPPSAVRRRRSTQDETANWSPNKKRARFMLEDKGLREPGRDSGANELLRLGRDGGGRGGGAGRDAAVDNENDDEDDDGLEIV